jgi:hypothetical protein
MIHLKNLVQGFVLLPNADTGCPKSLSSACIKSHPKNDLLQFSSCAQKLLQLVQNNVMQVSLNAM